MFPLPSGDFPLEEMTSRTHFEVNGDGVAAIPTVPKSPGDKGLAPSAARAGGCFLFEARQAATSSGAMPQSPGDKGLAPSAARAGGCFLFEARQAATSSGAMLQFRCPLTRTFTRAVQLVDEGLVPLQTLYLRVTEVECNVNFIGEKLDSREALVVVDSKGMEIHESPEGSGFWKPKTRKVLCMTESVFGEYQTGRQRKHRSVCTYNSRVFNLYTGQPAQCRRHVAGSGEDGEDSDGTWEGCHDPACAATGLTDSHRGTVQWNLQRMALTRALSQSATATFAVNRSRPRNSSVKGRPTPDRGGKRQASTSSGRNRTRGHTTPASCGRVHVSCNRPLEKTWKTTEID